jgi:hypothetical protein
LVGTSITVKELIQILELPFVEENKMKKGDLVVIDDLSYSRMVKDGKLVSPPTNFLRRHINKKFIIVEIGCRFPKTSQWSDVDCNNTVIQAINTDEVVFIEERFLVPAKHQITIDGKTIEVSHESYLELKKSLT